MREFTKRDEIEGKYKWNLKDIFSSLVEWQNTYKQVEENIDKLIQYEGELSISSIELLKFLTLDGETSQMYERLSVYARMQEDENTKDPSHQTLVQKLSPLGQKYAKLSFFTNEILALNESGLEAFILEQPKLAFFEKYLKDILRSTPHILSPEKEEILAQSGLLYSASNTFSKLDNADITFKSIIDQNGNELSLTNSSYYTHIASPIREVRKQAFKNLYSSYMGMRNTIASTMLGNLKKDMFFAKVRNYKNSIESALFDDNIPVIVYDNLVETVKQNVRPLHRYLEIRKEMLGVDELHMYDLSVPLVTDYEINISYDEAYDTMKDALSVLGKEYIEVLDQARDSGWIDVYSTDGKRNGAYSWGPYGIHPYVLLNHKDDMDSMFTLSHEVGHMMHSYFSDRALPHLYAQYSIFVAEVASTVNEILLMRHLLNQAKDEKMKISLIIEFLDKFKSTLYRQTQFAEFERITHEKVDNDEPLTGEDMNKIYLQLNKDYYGESVVHDEEICYEWSRIPHFYNSFYVYQYATGLSAAIAISERILTEGEPAVADYLAFLRSGGTDEPIELLKIAGVDMSTPEPIENALLVFENLVIELEKLTSDK